MAEPRLYIQVRNGGPYEHPIHEENMRAVFPDFDPNNPPDGFEEFFRHPLPTCGPFEVYVDTYYEKHDGKWQDYHHVRKMTPTEKAERLRDIRENFPFPSWTLDEETLNWTPPFPPPDQEKHYFWDEQKQDWYEVPDEQSAEIKFKQVGDVQILVDGETGEPVPDSKLEEVGQKEATRKGKE